MTVVLIVFFSILLVSFITGIIITVIEEKKSSSFVILDKFVLPERIQLVQTNSLVTDQESLEKTMRMNKVDSEDYEEYHEETEILSLEKTLIMNAIEVENLENTMYFETPILTTDYDDEII